MHVVSGVHGGEGGNLESNKSRTEVECVDQQNQKFLSRLYLATLQRTFFSVQGGGGEIIAATVAEEDQDYK